MKKIVVLISVLFALLGLTWFLTESGVTDRSFEFDKKLQAALRYPTFYKLPQATLVYKDSYWQSSLGVVLRAELLEELHRSLESIKIHRVIEETPDRESFFKSKIEFQINDLTIEWGEMSPTMDSFYLGIKGDPRVYVMDLNQLGSLAVGDNENVLRQAKYQRLRDLINFPEHGWQETRLFQVLRRSGFQLFKKGSIKLDPIELSKRSWGNEVIKKFVAGLQSLEIMGEIKSAKPKGLSVVDSWQLTMQDGSEDEWQFYPHPEVDLIYVWISSMQKAYPLNEASSELIKVFPERLIDQPFMMQILEEGETISFNPSLNEEAQRSFEEFLRAPQNYDLLSVEASCTSSGIAMRINEFNYQLSRQSESWTIQDCITGIKWTYRLPKNSPLDFSLDSAKLVP